MNNIHLLCLVLVMAVHSTISKAGDHPVTANATACTPDNDPELQAVEAICARFYNEVCMTRLTGPVAVENEEGYYILDLESYKTELGKTGLFTAAFIAARDVVFNECATALEQEKITPEQAWEGGIEMNAPYNCGFLNANYYFNAQEDPDGFRLEDMIVSDSAAFVVMRYYTSDWTWSVYLTIGLVKGEDGWYIDKVERLSKND